MTTCRNRGQKDQLPHSTGNSVLLRTRPKVSYGFFWPVTYPGQFFFPNTAKKLPLEPAPARWALSDNFVTVCRCTQTNARTIVPTNNFLYCPVSNVRVTDAKTCDFLQAVVQKCLDSSSDRYPKLGSRFWGAFFRFVYMCMVGVCVYVHAHVAYTCGEGLQLTQDLGLFFILSPLYILRQGDRVDHLNPELDNLSSLARQLVWGIPSKSWDDKWATMTTWQLCGCWRSKPGGRQALHFLSHFPSFMDGKV